MQGIASRAIRYFYDPEPMNDNPACPPIWCLGREYDSRASDEIEGRAGDAAELRDIGPRPWPRKFLDDFEARIWMTYRSGFPCIQRRTSTAKSGKDSQTGVADTLRSFIGDVLGDKRWVSYRHRLGLYDSISAVCACKYTRAPPAWKRMAKG